MKMAMMEMMTMDTLLVRIGIKWEIFIMLLLSASTKPRFPRPPHVKYRVGQVIKHKKWGYRGVIIGWDPVTKVVPGSLNNMSS
jgi:hypothetical protein